MATNQWVFIRGLIRQRKHWEEFPAKFQAAFPEARIHLVDLPGNGSLFEETSPLSVNGLMEAARAQVREQAGFVGPVNLMSISLGGMVAIEWMTRHPEEIDAAVVMNSSVRRLGITLDRLKPELFIRYIGHLLFDRTLENKEKLIVGISSNTYPDKEDLAARWVSYARTQPTSLKNTLRQTLAAARYAGPRQSPHDRVLLLASAKDRIVGPSGTYAMADAWHWPVHTHPSAGHDLPLDAGEWTIERVREWIESSDRSRSPGALRG